MKKPTNTGSKALDLLAAWLLLVAVTSFILFFSLLPAWYAAKAAVDIYETPYAGPAVGIVLFMFLFGKSAAFAGKLIAFVQKLLVPDSEL